MSVVVNGGWKRGRRGGEKGIEETEAAGRKRRRPEAREPFAAPFVYREFSHY